MYTHEKNIAKEKKKGGEEKEKDEDVENLLKK